LRAKALSWGTVLFFDPYQPVDRALGIGRVTTKEELFERSDTPGLHCPLTKGTREVAGKELLGRIKDGECVGEYES
jgi:phosphoglycerate dehydrogenase-like enzyme